MIADSPVQLSTSAILVQWHEKVLCTSHQCKHIIIFLLISPSITLTFFLCLPYSLCSDTLLKTGCSANTFLGVGPTLAMPPPMGCYVTPPGVYYTHHLRCLETPPFK